MAVVGSAYIKILADTSGISDSVQKAFSAISPDAVKSSGSKLGKSLSTAISKNIDSNIFTKLGDAMSNFGGAAGTARNTLFQLTKTGNIAGVSIATLLGGVMALIGGLAGLAGAVGGAIPAIMGLVGAFVSLRVGIAVGQLALSGISQAVSSAISQQKSYAMTLAQSARQTRDLAFASEDAQRAVGRANLNFEKARSNLLRTQDLPASSFARREALQQYAEAELALRKAKAKVKDAKSEQADPNIFKGGQDPFADLTPSQKTFAKFLLSIQDEFKNLKEAAASGFLPILQTNMQKIIKEVFPTFEQGLKDIGIGLGGLTTNLTNAITDPGNVKLLGEVMQNIADNLPVIGEILGNVYGSFLIILKESDPLVKNFLDFLNTKTKTMKDYLQAKAATGEMKEFFARSEEIMADLGVIFGNTLGGLGAIIGANFEPGSGGDIMLQWLKDVTGKWNDLDSTVKGKNALKQYFIDTATNTTKVLDSVGALVEQFIILGANPNIGKTFDALAVGAPAMGSIAQKLVDAGPSFGTLVSDVVIFIDKLTDTKAITNFFDTIDSAVKKMIEFLELPGVQKTIDFLGQIHGYIFGYIAVTRLAGFGVKIYGEIWGAVLTPVKNVFNALTEIGTAGQMMPSKFGGFRTMFDDIRLRGMYAGDGIKIVFARIGTVFMTSVVPVIMSGISAIGTAFAAITPVGWIVIAVVAITAFFAWFFTQTDLGKEIFANMTEFLGKAWEKVVGFFKTVWEAGLAFFKPAIDVMTSIFKTSMDVIRGIMDVLGAIFTIIFVVIGTIVQAAWDTIVAKFNVAVGIIRVVVEGISNFFNPIFRDIGKFVGDIWKGMQDGFKKFVDWIKPAIDPILGFFKTVFGNVSNFFKTIMNNMIGFMEGFMNFFIDGLNTIILGINKIKLEIPPILRGAFGGAKSIGFNIAPVAKARLPRLAKGGTVMPSAGGSLVTVAEAGRPERVEPLDPNGLSNRDKAMIEFLSKGQAATGRPIQLNVYPAAGMDERELAAIVSRTLAFELRKGGM